MDELGVEPGPALRARMEAILRHAPSLAVGVAAGVSDGWRDPDAALLELGREIARLGVRIESLGREQEALIRRFNLLSPTPAAAPVPGDQLV